MPPRMILTYSKFCTKGAEKSFSRIRKISATNFLKWNNTSRGAIQFLSDETNLSMTVIPEINIQTAIQGFKPLNRQTVLPLKIIWFKPSNRKHFENNLIQTVTYLF